MFLGKKDPEKQGAKMVTKLWSGYEFRADDKKRKEVRDAFSAFKVGDEFYCDSTKFQEGCRTIDRLKGG